MIVATERLGDLLKITKGWSSKTAVTERPWQNSPWFGAFSTNHLPPAKGDWVRSSSTPSHLRSWEETSGSGHPESSFLLFRYHI